MTLSKRVATRRSLAVVATLAITATLSAAAHAQQTGTPPVATAGAAQPVPSSTTAPPVVTTPTSAHTGAAQAAAAQPAAPTATSPTASAARLSISATVAAGPFLVGEQVPVEVRIANTGDTEAVGVKANAYTVSGSTFSVQYSDWGDFALGPGPGATLPAGQERVLTVRGDTWQWSGAPVVRFTLVQGNTTGAYSDLSIPLRNPGSAEDTLAGLVYGDRNGNGAPDAGEQLPGVHVNADAYDASGELDLHATTDADGRFRFAGLPVQVYTLRITDEPDGWVVEPSYSRVAVDGSGSAANLVLRGERPLTDQLSVTMRFTRDVYQVGDRADIVVTLTNSGTTDLVGIKAGCDRSGGEGPELRDVALGDLGWHAAGVTVPAGQSLAVTVSGSVSAETAEYGAVGYPCDFGPGADGIDGRPRAYALAKVPGPAVTVRMAFYHDRDHDRTGDADEMIGGLAMDLTDAITGRIVAQGRTDAQGHVRFDNVPSGPYKVRFRGSWRYLGGEGFIVFAGTCGNCQAESWSPLVPGPDLTNVRRAGG
ncbi:SdrD B-like protein [Saccharothrix carnea]|uniref:SdrD B-like protein n=1 Tax=Saccharothrix carnea TaxID=1280637 RepID=A0A2P8IAM8_SACCR|nr:SdrD B-like domain-containing protein [Saccharothrix carnea]PSL55512.1 SdrD B-like protein [Saccharothrix carnea]